MDNKKCGAFLQLLRKSKGLTQQQLADILSVSSKTVSKWECGTNVPDVAVLMMLAEFYQVSVDEILRGERQSAHSQRASFAEVIDADTINLRYLNKNKETIKWFTISTLAVFAFAIILQIILNFTTTYITSFAVNFSLSTFAFIMFFVGAEISFHDVRTKLQGDNLAEFDKYLFNARYLLISIFVCNVLQLIVPFCFMGRLDIFQSANEVNGLNSNNNSHIDILNNYLFGVGNAGAYSLAEKMIKSVSAIIIATPLVVFALGAMISIGIYYRIAEYKFNTKTPHFAKVILSPWKYIILYVFSLILALFSPAYNHAFSYGTPANGGADIMPSYSVVFGKINNVAMWIFVMCLVLTIILAIISYVKKWNYSFMMLSGGVTFGFMYHAIYGNNDIINEYFLPSTYQEIYTKGNAHFILVFLMMIFFAIGIALLIEFVHTQRRVRSDIDEIVYGDDEYINEDLID